MSLLNAVLLESKVEMTIVCLFPKAPNVSVTRKDCVVSCSAIELRSECEHARDKKMNTQIIYFLLWNVLLQAFCWDFYRPLLPETPFFCFLLSTVFAESLKRAADRSDALVVGAVHVRASLRNPARCAASGGDRLCKI